MSDPSATDRSDQTIGYTPAEPDDAPLPATHRTTPVAPGQSLRFSQSRTSFRGPVVGDPADPDNQVGPYEVIDELGQGGMGVVYRARHVSLNRTVALKMILGGAGSGPAQLARFMTEAEAVARLQHPGIVQVFDVGEHRGQPYMAMELIDGGSLADRLDGKPQNPRFAAQMAETLCRAMAVAHQFNVVHRDLKPHNVLLTRDGQPKITDFGLAKDLDRLSSNTRAGSILGTPSYMAPEQAAGRVADIGPGTDVYALGAILYEMLCGRPPFRGESPIDTIRLVLDGEVTPVRQLVPKVPRDLDTICLKALQKPIHRRYLSAAEMAEDLRRFLDGEPIRARPIGPVERTVKLIRRRPTAASLVATGVAALVGFLALGVLSYRAVSRQVRVAEDALAEGTRKMVRLNVANGTRLLDDGDYLGSVLWFAEALKVEPGGPDREWVHRVRLKAVLDRCPRPVRTWLHEEGALTAAVFGADGRVVLTAGEDGVARVWDVATGGTAGPPLEHGSPVRFVAVSPDGTRAATAGTDGALRVWVVKTGELAFPPVILGVQFTGLAYSPRGDRILAVGAAGRARVWDAADGGVVSTMTVPFEGKVTAVAFAPDGRRYAVGSTDQTVRVFETENSQAVGATLLHEGPVTAVAFAPDGKRLLTGAADKTARMWDADTGRAVPPAPIRHPDPVTGVAFGPDGRKIATACADQTAQVWDAATGMPLGRPAVHNAGVQGVTFGPDGRWFATRGDDNTARVWDAATGEPVSPPFQYTATPVAVRFSPDGHGLLVAAKNRTVQLWELITPADLTETPGAAPPSVGPGTVTSPNGKMVLGYGAGQTARVRDAATHDWRSPPLRTGAAATAAAFAPDDARVATGDEDGAVQVWRVEDGAAGWKVPGRHGSKVSAAAFSPNGELLATGSADNTARVWDAADGSTPAPPINVGAMVVAVGFNADGRLLVTVADTGTARAWDVATGVPLTPPLYRPDAGWADRLAPTDEPIDKLQTVGRLFAGKALTPDGDVRPLDPTELGRLAAEFPRAFDITPAEVQKWSEVRAAEAEKAGDWFAAAWHLDRLAAAAPGDVDLRRRRAAAAFRVGDFDAAVRLDPLRPDGWFKRGIARGSGGEWDRAAADLAKAVELRAEPAAGVGLAAKVALDAGDRDRYRQLTAELAKALDGLDPPAARRAVWACVLSPDTGADPAKMAEAAEKLAAGPATFGLALVRAGRPADAVGVLKSPCEAAGDRPAAWLAYALAVAKLGRPAEAKPWRDKADAWLTAGRKADGVPPSWDERTDAEALVKEFDGDRRKDATP